MNTPDDLPEDEMVSAVLDGEADDATRARVMDSPVLAARLAEFAAMRDDLRAFTVPEDLLDDMRRTVVAETAPSSTRPVAPVFALSAKRARRAKAAAWIGAAAAAVLLVVAIGVTGGGDGGGDGSSDASMTAAFGTGALAESSQRADAAGGAPAPNLSAGTGSTGAAGSSGSGAGSGAGTKTPAGIGATPPLDLGAVTDLDALAAAYRAQRSRLPTTTTTTTPAAAAAPTAANTICGTASAVAVVGGRPVVLLAGREVIAVVDGVSCAPVGAFVL